MPDSSQKRVDELIGDRITLGKKLKDAREYLDLSQDEVAKEVGISRAAISLIESGQRRIGALELKEFARVYQRNISYFTGENATEGETFEDIEPLKRAFKELSDKDREEVTRFAEFLRSRSTGD